MAAPAPPEGAGSAASAGSARAGVRGPARDRAAAPVRARDPAWERPAAASGPPRPRPLPAGPLPGPPLGCCLCLLLGLPLGRCLGQRLRLQGRLPLLGELDADVLQPRQLLDQPLLLRGDRVGLLRGSSPPPRRRRRGPREPRPAAGRPRPRRRRPAGGRRRRASTQHGSRRSGSPSPTRSARAWSPARRRRRSRRTARWRRPRTAPGPSGRSRRRRRCTPAAASSRRRARYRPGLQRLPPHGVPARAGTAHRSTPRSPGPPGPRSPGAAGWRRAARPGRWSRCVPGPGPRRGHRAPRSGSGGVGIVRPGGADASRGRGDREDQRQGQDDSARTHFGLPPARTGVVDAARAASTLSGPRRTLVPIRHIGNTFHNFSSAPGVSA